MAKIDAAGISHFMLRSIIMFSITYLVWRTWFHDVENWERLNEKREYLSFFTFLSFIFLWLGTWKFYFY